MKRFWFYKRHWYLNFVCELKYQFTNQQFNKRTFWLFQTKIISLLGNISRNRSRYLLTCLVAPAFAMLQILIKSCGSPPMDVVCSVKYLDQQLCQWLWDSSPLSATQIHFTRWSPTFAKCFHLTLCQPLVKHHQRITTNAKY